MVISASIRRAGYHFRHKGGGLGRLWHRHAGDVRGEGIWRLGYWYRLTEANRGHECRYQCCYRSPFHGLLFIFSFFDWAERVAHLPYDRLGSMVMMCIVSDRIDLTFII